MFKLTIKTQSQINDELVYEAQDWSTPEKVAEWYMAALKMDMADKKFDGYDPGRTHGGMGKAAIAEFKKLPDCDEVLAEFRELFGYGLFDFC